MRHIRTIGTPVVLLALLAFLIWGASWGWKNLTAPLPSPSPTPCVTVPAKSVTPSNVTIRSVANGGFTPKLATKVGDHLKSQGFEVLHVRNTEERVAATIIRGNAESAAALELVASHFKDATIEHDDRVDGTVDVLVGTQYAGAADAPLPEVITPEGVVCEFVSPSPDASVEGSTEASEEPTPAEG